MTRREVSGVQRQFPAQLSLLVCHFCPPRYHQRGEHGISYLRVMKCSDILQARKILNSLRESNKGGEISRLSPLGASLAYVPHDIFILQHLSGTGFVLSRPASCSASRPFMTGAERHRKTEVFDPVTPSARPGEHQKRSPILLTSPTLVVTGMLIGLLG